MREYSDSEYAAELDRIRERFSPLVKFCKEHGRAMRIGTNHGSLSDRILNRYGDTPLGMVESALEFARIARELDYHAFVFSMKASNPKVMIEAYRLLTARLLMEENRPPSSEESLAADSWQYPLHLGVTEAGDGEDGRIKSAIGIGSLLTDGIGDTIRVSLTEDSVHEIPVAQALVRQTERLAQQGERAKSIAEVSPTWDPFSFSRRETARMEIAAAHPPSARTAVGGEEVVRVAVTPERVALVAHKLERLGDFTPDFVTGSTSVMAIDPRDAAAIAALQTADEPHLVTVADGIDLPVITAFRLLAAKLESRHPILLKDTLQPAAPGSDQVSATFLEHLLTAGTNLGALLCDGIGDAVLVQGEAAPGQALRLSFNTLQAAGSRIFKTDYVACPSCGRTLFNLQETTARIKEATVHLKGVKIAIMGCIVNGPGEMADADFGYVGGAPGKINLYVGKKPVKFNIPQAEAVERLKDLIKEHGKWIEPALVSPGAAAS